MSEIEDGLLAIEVDTDDAESGDAPVESRTFQSETDFERQKAAYAAKVDGGKAYKDLMVAVPVLDPAHDCIRTNGHAKSKLTKKDVQLLGYAVAQLYYDNQYAKVISLCERVEHLCETDDKTTASLTRWMERCQKRRATRSVPTG